VGAAGCFSHRGVRRVSRSAIAVIGSPMADATIGLAATLAVAVAKSDQLSCLLVEIVSEDSAKRSPTLLASTEARAIEGRLGDSGIEGASRGHICSISLTDERWEEVGPSALIELALPSRVVFSFGAEAPHERISALGDDLAGCVALLDLPAERPLGAILAAEMLDRGAAVKITARQPGPVAARRALAGVMPGGAAEQYAEHLVSCLMRSRRRTLDGPQGVT